MFDFYFFLLRALGQGLRGRCDIQTEGSSAFSKEINGEKLSRYQHLNVENEVEGLFGGLAPQNHLTVVIMIILPPLLPSTSSPLLR